MGDFVNDNRANGTPPALRELRVEVVKWKLVPKYRCSAFLIG